MDYKYPRPSRRGRDHHTISTGQAAGHAADPVLGLNRIPKPRGGRRAANSLATTVTTYRKRAKWHGHKICLTHLRRKYRRKWRIRWDRVASTRLRDAVRVQIVRIGVVHFQSGCERLLTCTMGGWWRYATRLDPKSVRLGHRVLL